MNCREVRSYVGESDFDASFPVPVEAHLDQCPACAEYARDARASHERLLCLTRSPVPNTEIEDALARLLNVATTGLYIDSSPTPSFSLKRFRWRGKARTMQTEQTPVTSYRTAVPNSSRRQWAGMMGTALLMGVLAGLWFTQVKTAHHSAQDAALTPTQEQQRAQATQEVVANHLKQLGIGFFMYQDRPPAQGNALTPPMDNAEAMKKAILPFVGNSDCFVNPRTGADFATNPYVGNKKMDEIPGKTSEVVIIYEASADAGGGRFAAFLDGHVAYLSPEEWEQRREESHLP